MDAKLWVDIPGTSISNARNEKMIYTWTRNYRSTAVSVRVADTIATGWSVYSVILIRKGKYTVLEGYHLSAEYLRSTDR